MAFPPPIFLHLEYGWCLIIWTLILAIIRISYQDLSIEVISNPRSEIISWKGFGLFELVVTWLFNKQSCRTLSKDPPFYLFFYFVIYIYIVCCVRLFNPPLISPYYINFFTWYQSHNTAFALFLGQNHSFITLLAC